MGENKIFSDGDDGEMLLLCQLSTHVFPIEFAN